MTKLNQQYSFPTHEQFMAYVKGKMGAKEKASFETAVQSDAFIAEALEGYQRQPNWVGSITDQVNADIQMKYPAGKSGAGKWMYFSIAAILMVILAIVWVNRPQEKKQSIADNDQVIHSNDQKETNESIVPIDQKKENASWKEENDFVLDEEQNEGFSEDKLKSDDFGQKDDFIEEEEVNKSHQEDDYKEEIVFNLNKKEENKKEGNKKPLSGSARLAVIDVAIGVKEHPMLDSKQKTKIKNGQVVTIDKTRSNPKYSQEDLPSYYGGDDALLAEIKGSIRPVVVNLDPKYDRVIGFDFEVAADGKVDAKTLNFKGNPYPEIRKQIEKMIQNFPMFIPGKASGKKGRIRYGIMLKY